MPVRGQDYHRLACPCRPKRRAKRFADVLPGETQTQNGDDEDGAAAADDDDDLFVDLDLKAPDEEGAQPGSNRAAMQGTQVSSRSMPDSF